MQVGPMWKTARNQFEAWAPVVRLRQWYGRFVSWQWLLALFLLITAVFGWAFSKRDAVVLGPHGWVAEDGCQYSVPDNRMPPYRPAEASEALGRLGESEQQFYAWTELTLDVAFPMVYATFLGAFLVFLVRRRSHRQLSFCLAYPVLAALADFCENIGYAGLAVQGGHGWAILGFWGSWGKWTFLLLYLFALAITLRTFLGRLLEHLMVIRVALLAFMIVNLLWILAGSSSLPTVTNMMVSHNAIGLATAVFAAVLTTAIIALAGSLAWRLGPERLGFQGLRSPDWIEHTPVWTVVVLLPVLTSPMLVRLWQGSGQHWVDFLGLLGGLGLAILLLGALEWSRSRGKLQGVANKLIPFLKTLGPGYLEDREGGEAEQVRRGHPLAMGVTALLVIVFIAGYYWLSPDGAPRTIPTITYVLLLVALLCQALSGLSFFLDRFRFPLVLGIAAYAIGTSLLFPRNHYFDLKTESTIAAPSITEALGKRLEKSHLREPPSSEEPVLLTVIGATGGGIQAAAWTVQVLTGLQDRLGPEFTRSIQLISSASGGSVGTLFLMQEMGDDGALPHSPTHLAAIREAAMASSLDATAWGLVFSDLPRAFFPFLPQRSRDRAWAMEQAWLQNLECLEKSQDQLGCKLEPPRRRDEAWLSDWRQGATQGHLPGVIFNATFVEDGEPFLISNLDLASFSPGPNPLLGEHWSQAPTDFELREHYPGQGIIDMPIVTAARLSASFPYVTPVARARIAGSQRRLPRWQVSDGGFFDNFGTTASVRWIQQAVAALQEKGKAVRVLYVQINAFPPSQATPPCSNQGWVQGALGPIKTIVNVRNSTQRVRNDLELEILAQFLENPPTVASTGVTSGNGERSLSSNEVPDDAKKKPAPISFTAVTFRPPPVEARSPTIGKKSIGTRRNPPLSWELSEDDKKQVAADWQHAANQDIVDFLKQTFFVEATP